MNLPVQAVQRRQSLTQHFDMRDERLANGDRIDDVARERSGPRESRERDTVNGMQLQARRQVRFDQGGVCPGVQDEIVRTTIIDTDAYNEDVAVQYSQRNTRAGVRGSQTKWAKMESNTSANGQGAAFCEQRHRSSSSRGVTGRKLDAAAWRGLDPSMILRREFVMEL